MWNALRTRAGQVGCRVFLLLDVLRAGSFTHLELPAAAVSASLALYTSADSKVDDGTSVTATTGPATGSYASPSLRLEGTTAARPDHKGDDATAAGIADVSASTSGTSADGKDDDDGQFSTTAGTTRAAATTASPSNTSKPAPAVTLNEDDIQYLVEAGHTRDWAIKGLQASEGKRQVALDWIMANKAAPAVPSSHSPAPAHSSRTATNLSPCLSQLLQKYESFCCSIAREPFAQAFAQLPADLNGLAQRRELCHVALKLANVQRSESTWHPFNPLLSFDPPSAMESARITLFDALEQGSASSQAIVDFAATTAAASDQALTRGRSPTHTPHVFVDFLPADSLWRFSVALFSFPSELDCDLLVEVLSEAGVKEENEHLIHDAHLRGVLSFDLPDDSPEVAKRLVISLKAVKSSLSAVVPDSEIIIEPFFPVAGLLSLSAPRPIVDKAAELAKERRDAFWADRPKVVLDDIKLVRFAADGKYLEPDGSLRIWSGEKWTQPATLSPADTKCVLDRSHRLRAALSYRSEALSEQKQQGAGDVEDWAANNTTYLLDLCDIDADSAASSQMYAGNTNAQDPKKNRLVDRWTAHVNDSNRLGEGSQLVHFTINKVVLDHKSESSVGPPPAILLCMGLSADHEDLLITRFSTLGAAGLNMMRGDIIGYHTGCSCFKLDVGTLSPLGYSKPLPPPSLAQSLSFASPTRSAPVSLLSSSPSGASCSSASPSTVPSAASQSPPDARPAPSGPASSRTPAVNPSGPLSSLSKNTWL